jgi:mannosylfructose-phosphate synthase
MITNHGIHQWEVIPGLPDTGGQNVFVNQLTGALARLGFKITIANRGGFPHPVTGEPRRGLHYQDGTQRILYLEDGYPAFVRKEEMNPHLPRLSAFLASHLTEEDLPVDVCLSHYWDAARIGSLFTRRLSNPPLHAWVPHSLGAIKKRNMPPETWDDLRVDERIAIERALISEVDAAVATSRGIREAMRHDYGYDGPDLFLPPCVDPERYRPRRVQPDDPLWRYLADRTGLRESEVPSRRLVTEISRTDETKRKDVLIRAFARVRKKHPEGLLVVSIDENQPALAASLGSLIQELALEPDVAVVGSIWDLLPSLYAASAIYCTPSVMEGFGMSAQEAAASGVPVVASELVPFATEYLLGGEIEEMPIRENEGRLQFGEGAVVAPADSVAGFAAAITRLLADESRRRAMGARAHQITVPYFTWDDRGRAFLHALGVPLPNQEGA